MGPSNACSGVRCTTWQRTTRAQRQATTLSRSPINFLTGATQERETPHPPTTRAWRDTHWLATEPSLGNLGAHAEPHQRPRKDVITRPHRWRAIDSPRSWSASTPIPLPIPHPPRVQRANLTPVTGNRTGRAVTTPVARGIPAIRPGRLKPRS